VKLSLINESISNKILLLVHPDAMSSDYHWTKNQSKEYLDKLKLYVPKFDKLIIFRMHGPIGAKDIENADQERSDHFRELNKILAKADLDLYDKDLGSTLFNNDISSYLIENPGGIIYLSGGYQSGCLRQVAHHLSENIGWVIKEQGYKVKVFEPLVFRFERGSGPEGRHADHPWWEKNWPGKSGEWGHEEEQEYSKTKFKVPKDYRFSGGLTATGGEYKRGDWWEGPTKEV